MYNLVLSYQFKSIYNLIITKCYLNISLMQSRLIILLFVILSVAYSQDQSLGNQQQQYLLQFAQIMSDFIPTQSYTFDLLPGEQLSLSFWQDDRIDHLRGVYYISQGIEQGDQKNFGLTIYTARNNQIQQIYQNRKLGIVKLDYTSGEMSLVFKSQKLKLKIYLSYELTKKSKAKKIQQTKAAAAVDAADNPTPENPTPAQNEEVKQKKTKMSQISERFFKTQSEVKKIESVVRTVMSYEEMYKVGIDNNIKWSHLRIIFQTLLVIGSGSFCLYVLRKKLKRGYQLLV